MLDSNDQEACADAGRGAVVQRRLATVHETLKCVWSGEADGAHSCAERIPVAVVERAWRRQMDDCLSSEGFFHFNWRGGAWLAYGLPDGSVRGVYCPTHRTARAARRGGAGQRAATRAALR